MHEYWGGHMGWGLMGLWWVIVLLFVVAAVWLAASALGRGGAALPPGAPPRETPEQILKRRYASGEIDRDTYQRTLDELRR